MAEISELIEVQKLSAIRQQRIYILCILYLPEDVRDKTPQSVVKQCHGEFLLGFSFLPKKGDRFPYGNQIWQLSHTPIQIPTRYKSQQKKHPASVICSWISSYIDIEEAVRVLLLLENQEK